MSLSKRHHYLPEVYLKGFTGEDGKLSVYDIQKKALRKGRYSPKQVYYEWNRNTLEINHLRTDFLEGLYKNIDQTVTPVLKKIQGSLLSADLNPYDYLNLIFFQGVTYWRIPSTDDEIVNHVRTASKNDLFIKFFDTITNEEVPDEIYHRLISEKAFIESYRIPKAIFDYLRSNKEFLLDTWKITYSKGPPSLHLIGDNPILTLVDSVNNIYETESIFPISSSKSLWHLYSGFPKLIPPEATVTIDQLIFLQSERYVCGPNPEYLKAVADLCQKPYNDNMINYLKHEIFNKL
jgi:hypothetical protein